MLQTWYVNSNETPSAAGTTITAWSDAGTTNKRVKITTGGTVTPSSGVFTFTDEGYYLIEASFKIGWDLQSSTNNEIYVQVQISVNSGSTWTTLNEIYGEEHANALVGSNTMIQQTFSGKTNVNIDDASTQRIRFQLVCGSATANTRLIGGASATSLVSWVDFTQAGLPGQIGPQGNTGASGASATRTATIGYFVDLNNGMDGNPLPARMPLSFPLDVPATRIGWPILPEGGGASYNTHANAGANGFLNELQAQRPLGYGTIMPAEGTIKLAGAQWWNGAGGAYEIRAINYSTGVNAIITNTPAVVSATQQGATNLLDPITFLKDHVIGIYVVENDIGQPAPKLTVYGQLYVTLNITP